MHAVQESDSGASTREGGARGCVTVLSREGQPDASHATVACARRSIKGVGLVLTIQ